MGPRDHDLPYKLSRLLCSARCGGYR
jgi:hypothetical protein